MNITIITPPPFEPVTLLEVYAQLRLTPDHLGSPGEETHPDDAMLSQYIATARDEVEGETGRSLVQQTLRLSSAGWEWWRWPTRTRCYSFRLYRPPLVAVESVSYYDGDNALQTIEPASYYTTDEQIPELRFVETFVAPTTYDRPDAVRVEYRTGYAPDGSPPTTQAEYAAHVPSPLKDAILIGVQLLYDNLPPLERQAMIDARKALISRYCLQVLA